MQQPIKMLDTVALLADFPEKNLRRGQVGVIVELLPNDHFLVEFADKKGRTVSMPALPASILLVLEFEAIAA